jgi:amino acid adenylation domain-containing protein/thioester reductase-like protein
MTGNDLSRAASIDDKRAQLTRVLAARSGNTNVGPDQRRLWTLLELDADVPCERHAMYDIEGALDLAVLQQAIGAVLARHDVLRSTFDDVAGVPLRIAGLAPDFELTVLDGTPDDAGDNAAAGLGDAHDPVWARWLAEPREPRDPRPLVRVAVIRRGPDAHRLLIAIHELVADDASLALFVEQAFASYEALCTGQDVRTTAPAFAAFARAERAWLASADLRVELQRWRTALAEAVPLRFPVDRPRPEVKTHRSASVRTVLTASQAADLETLAVGLSSTPEEVVLTGFAVLLARHTGQLDCTVGIDSGRRRHRAWRRTIGPVASAAPLRIDLSTLGDPPSFARAVGAVGRLRDAAVGAAMLPFATLVDELQPPRDLSRTPLYQVSFEWTDAGYELAAAGLVVRPRAVPAARTAVDLTLAATRLTDGIALRLDFNTDLCDAATAARMLQHLAMLLASAVARPEQAIARLAMVSDAELEAIEAWNATTAADPADRCLHDWVSEQARRSPDAIAVRCGDGSLTFAELEQRSNQLAHHLRGLGLAIEGKVAICLERSTATIVAILGALKAGGAYIPLDPEYPDHRLRELVSDSQASIVITERALADRVPGGAARRVLIDDDWPAIAALPASAPAAVVTPENLAYLIYTSGSTGQPKAVMVAHRSAVNNIAWRQRTWALSPDDRVMHNHSFSFDPSVWATFWPLIAGAQLIVTPPRTAYDVGALVGLIRRHGVTVYGGVPSFHALVMEGAGNTALDSLRLVLSGGEALGAEVQRAVFAHTSAVLANLYGPTEATIDATVWVCPRVPDPQPAPIGAPLANLTAHVLDDDMRPVPIGVAGEIYLGGLGVARGYHGRARLTAERFVPDPWSRAPGARLYRTGDRGLRRADGAVVFLGRADDQIKVRGFRIELGEIEALLAEHPQVREAAVLAVDDDAGNRRLIGYVGTRPDTTLTGAELASHLAARVPAYMVPWKVIAMPELPKHAGGKIARGALPVPRAADAAAPGDDARPRTQLEDEVAQTFAMVLGREVGIHVDFFEAGGTSLMLARAAARLIARFQMTLAVHEFFRVPTIAGVAQVVELYQREGIEAVLTRQHAEHLEADATLAPEIRADGLPLADHEDPSAVLLTGATGYLGAFMLQQLLERTRATVHCLIRARDATQALARLRDAMITYRIWSDDYLPRIVPVPGDLAKLRLGLDDAAWNELAERVDVIYHSGALVNFVYPYSALRAANVRGTEEVLRLACTHRLKSVHYVSTIDVLLAMHMPRPFIEDDAPLRAQVQVPAGYTGSKWVAEKVVHLAADRGIPVAIYRPGLILGHEDTGATQTNDYLLVAFRGFVPMGILPSYPRIFDTVPVDYVAKAIVHISTQRAAHGKFFHLFNPAPVSLARFCDWLGSYGYRFDIVDFEVARKRALEVDTSHPLYPLVPLIRDAEANPQESLDPAFIDRLQPDIECHNTLAYLAGSGIRCPAMTEELAHRCVRYLVEIGFLPPPEAVAPAWLPPPRPTPTLHAASES